MGGKVLIKLLYFLSKEGFISICRQLLEMMGFISCISLVFLLEACTAGAFVTSHTQTENPHSLNLDKVKCNLLFHSRFHLFKFSSILKSLCSVGPIYLWTHAVIDFHNLTSYICKPFLLEIMDN